VSKKIAFVKNKTLFEHFYRSAKVSTNKTLKTQQNSLKTSTAKKAYSLQSFNFVLTMLMLLSYAN